MYSNSLTDTMNRECTYGYNKSELTKVKEQLDKANKVINHLVYNSEDSQTLAYEYLEAYDLLKHETSEGIKNGKQ
jgi:hypothetical protein